MTCDTCKKKATCKELCLEAEIYVGQDTVPEQAESKVFKIAFESTFTIADFKDIEERKRDELIYYFQKIQDMPDSIEKIIMSLIFFGIPVDRIAKYLKISWQNVYVLLKKLEHHPRNIIR
jgi:hypothetical protein